MYWIKMTFVYNVIFILFAILYLPYTLIKGKWHKDFFSRFGGLSSSVEQRLATKSNIWIHAVSVGEVLAVVGVVKRLRELYPDYRIVCSTVTTTGNALAKSILDKDVEVIYAPLDFSLIVRKFIRVIKPQIYISAETEIWPNLYSELFKTEIPIVQVNGRISDQSFKGYCRIKFLMKSVLNCVHVFCVQSAVDADRMVHLGADYRRVHIVGNLKFDQPIEDGRSDVHDYGFTDTNDVLIAGSTHPGEEQILIKLFQNLRASFPELRLVLAPRHIERTIEVIQAVEQSGLKAIKFSEVSNQQPSLCQDCVLVVDTIGHLRYLYRIAKIVFIGKTLVGRGGQNVIEPAALGKATIVGPHVENFKDVVKTLLDKNAIIQVPNEEALELKITTLLNDQQLLSGIGISARQTIELNRGATDKAVGYITGLLKPA